MASQSEWEQYNVAEYKTRIDKLQERRQAVQVAAGNIRAGLVLGATLALEAREAVFQAVSAEFKRCAALFIPGKPISLSMDTEPDGSFTVSVDIMCSAASRTENAKWQTTIRSLSGAAP